jgi:hypothetical protein
MMFVAIGMDGLGPDRRPVVWGVGATARAAVTEAHEYTREPDEGPPWNQLGSAVLHVSAAIVRRVRAGEVECESLGIHVIKSHGRIAGASMRPAAVGAAKGNG